MKAMWWKVVQILARTLGSSWRLSLRGATERLSSGLRSTCRSMTIQIIIQVYGIKTVLFKQFDLTFLYINGVISIFYCRFKNSNSRFRLI